jgi:Tat protein secretion system quality control protein TatD with DNase activity
MSLPDAHCHVHLDTNAFTGLRECHAIKLGAMSVGGDWQDVTRLFSAYPSRIVRNFGIHPWSAHRYGMNKGETLRTILSAKSLDLADIPCLDNELDTSWKDELRVLIRCNPDACIGECGLDRAATIREEGIRGKAMVSIEHQKKIVAYHLSLGSEFQRPVSLHCVQATGHMEALLRSLSHPPPAVMLHSFSGSVESIKSLTSIPVLGLRIFFSFSSTINTKQENEKQRFKVLERIKTVADNRVLIESDQDNIGLIDDALDEALKLVSEAKQWSLEEASKRCQENFQAYYNLHELS